jgi:soluble lytic murein transglycosylase-like protein
LGFRLFISIALLAIGLVSVLDHWQREPEPTIWLSSYRSAAIEALELSDNLAESYVVSKAAWNRTYVSYLHRQRELAEQEWEPSEHLASLALQQNPSLGRSQANQIAQAIVDSAQRHEVDPFLVAALISQESKFRPNVVSPGGAVGLGQILPGTARGLGVDPYSPAQNVEGCVKYLRSHLNRWDGRVDLALASYNAGPGAVQRYGGVPPYRITRNYVAKIGARAQKFRATAKKARDRWMVANGPRMIDIFGRKVQTAKSAEPS